MGPDLTVQSCSAVKWAKALTYRNATTWVNLSVLSEKRESQKATSSMIPLILRVQNRQIYRDGKQISGCQGLGEQKSNC